MDQRYKKIKKKKKKRQQNELLLSQARGVISSDTEQREFLG
ncbi:hypothetical protein QG37_07562 [Candidozyma auris]|uniref:Uncharacterized protein n=1 Tax=Candidozyma auris TaxID=498019 RepID=A0A0L0NPJ8_CANAR|nr:hypothetical protein QG37_07562 [[Candida] auris]